MSLNGLLERLQRRGPAAVMAHGSWASEAPSRARYVDQGDGEHTAPTPLDGDVHAMVPATPPDTPDASCWPHSTAMNGAELDTFAARLARFTDRGLILVDAEALADRLVQRDREDDDRRACLECSHLGGHAAAWRCCNLGASGVSVKAWSAQLPGALVIHLQRCREFSPPDIDAAS